MVPDEVCGLVVVVVVVICGWCWWTQSAVNTSLETPTHTHRKMSPLPLSDGMLLLVNMATSEHQHGCAGQAAGMLLLLLLCTQPDVPPLLYPYARTPPSTLIPTHPHTPTGPYGGGF